MYSYWKFGILFSVVLLSACSVKTVDTSQLQKPKVAHVEWPRIPGNCEVPEYKVGTDSEIGTVVMVPYKQYLNQRGCERDRMRYTSSLTSALCFYRQDKQEKICHYYYPQEVKSE